MEKNINRMGVPAYVSPDFSAKNISLSSSKELVKRILEGNDKLDIKKELDPEKELDPVKELKVDHSLFKEELDAAFEYTRKMDSVKYSPFNRKNKNKK